MVVEPSRNPDCTTSPFCALYGPPTNSITYASLKFGFPIHLTPYILQIKYAAEYALFLNLGVVAFDQTHSAGSVVTWSVPCHVPDGCDKSCNVPQNPMTQWSSATQHAATKRTAGIMLLQQAAPSQRHCALTRHPTTTTTHLQIESPRSSDNTYHYCSILVISQFHTPPKPSSSACNDNLSSVAVTPLNN
jgi:hypothetical protein